MAGTSARERGGLPDAVTNSIRMGHPMGNLRTSNKRHKRAVAEAARPATAAPVAVAPKKAAKTKAA